MRTDPTAGVARVVGRGLITVLLLAFALFFVLPMVWLLLTSTKSPADLIHGNPLSPGSIGSLVTNWQHLMSFQDGAVLTWMTNSVVYSALSVALTLLVGIPAGYAMALMRFKGRRLLLIVTLVVMLMPATALVLPIFLELSYLGLVNKMASVVLPMSFFPFGVYLTYIYFSTSVPGELLDAARLDGCSESATFFRVALPLAKPVVALVAFFSFVNNWNNFFLPYVMLPNSGNYPMQVGLTQMLAATPTFNPVVGANAEVQPPELVLATLVSIAPVLLVFLFSQRFLVAGLTAGATKG
ncbi:carbohydrate ABC transporter permease [Nonomuraea sp. NEAU-A123]|uniref:carbohydrate ABC transporter permease n=1 Tax=Nonomuraea sp. NEAU-A123 TaxID=2839649 RepID=UPI001BE40074|nr:carbohydrate ABC transporter permease [Nonomuraea sp. NEAU-A123]MBT2231397.1 carbohydrate ABC transporter permease [Nonomuraea sp. NEAU-A123]